MNHGRPTADPKGEVIRVRVNDNTKSCLTKLSSRTGESISEIIRKSVDEYLSRNL